MLYMSKVTCHSSELPSPRLEKELEPWNGQYAEFSVIHGSASMASVHGSNFPKITRDSSDAHAEHFDTTTDALDEAIVTEYLDGTPQNLLVVRRNDTLNSDARAFASDGDVTMNALAGPGTFQSDCAAISGKMIDTATSSATLSEPMERRIRVRTSAATGRDYDDLEVQLQLEDEEGNDCESFTWFEYSAGVIPSDIAISGFNVMVTTMSTKDTEVFNNGGGPFLVQDDALYLKEVSCLDTTMVVGDTELTVAAAVRTDKVEEGVRVDLDLETPSRALGANRHRPPDPCPMTPCGISPAASNPHLRSFRSSLIFFPSFFYQRSTTIGLLESSTTTHTPNAMNHAIRQRATRAAIYWPHGAPAVPAVPAAGTASEALTSPSVRRFQSSKSANFSGPPCSRVRTKTLGIPTPRLQTTAAAAASSEARNYARRRDASSTNTTPPASPSSSNSASKPSPSTTEIDTSITSPINPPTSTIPPPLDLPVRDPNVGALKHLLATGKAYLTFYKTGLKAVLANYRSTRHLLSRTCNEAATPSTPAFQVPPLILTRQVGLPPPSWSRAEWVLYRRSRHDILRLPAFTLILLLFDELTPFAVYIFSGVVPLTCRIPRQVAEDEGKAEGRRHGSFQWLEKCKLEAKNRAISGAETGLECVEMIDAKPEAEFLDLGETKARVHATRSLGVVGGKWDWIMGINMIPPGAWWLKGMPRMAFLEADDVFLRRGGLSGTDSSVETGEGNSKPACVDSGEVTMEAISRSLMGLSEPEIALACKDRGFDVRLKSVKDLKLELMGWLWLTAGKDHEERRRRMTVLIMRRQKDWPDTREFALPEWYL
ncbi:hypothetical protein MKZ38_004344 [Zalerion maritima]|uniref:Letm1 RBD domain-containing protein n=1 Tax=Zalerion maritima TaxID=339359 RepID=A0AAD5WRP1_9PEZI|nr:hypothetical protein MKZ38_004344 [Zalerion maritima]